ncbi:hypothetical protein NQ317_001703 [Molorchus minor]|uniref:Smoothelin domain-containing protein n=1 Tax=Molorchus minor TaxID=1323400 RepID=A0ABQ9J4C3_9CUCU|nr:hypothetical protein NQ317_001703 [Molorchus minor]
MSPQREPLEPYPERHKSLPKGAFRALPGETDYPQKKGQGPRAGKISEFPSQLRKSPQREPLEPYPERQIPTKEGPKISEFPSQKSLLKRSHWNPTQTKQIPQKEGPDDFEFSCQAIKSPEKVVPSGKTSQKEPGKKAPQKPSLSKKSPTKKDGPVISEVPSQAPRPKKEEPIKKHQEKRTHTPKDRPVSESSSDEEEIEEAVTETNVTYLENKVPVNEPAATKKFISVLCREDEVDKSDVTKKTTEELLKQEIMETETSSQTHRTVKKDRPLGEPKKLTKKVETDEFIKNERNVTTEKYVPEKRTNRVTTTVTKTVNKSPIKKQPVVHKVEKTKFIGETEYSEEYCKNKPVKRPEKTTDKITLRNIENLNVNGDTTKEQNLNNLPFQKTPSKDSSIRKPEEPRGKKISQTKYTTTAKKTIASTDSVTRSRSGKQAETITSTTTTRKTVNVTSPSVKQKTGKTEIISPKKHIVTTTINVSPKTKLTIRAQPTKLQNGHVTSDSEDDGSEKDSLEGSTIDLTIERSREEKSTHATDYKSTITESTVKRTSDVDHTITKPRSDSKPTRKPENKCVTTKTVIINNQDKQREVVVDLQRSTSSREPTPDRVCPVPLSSDEDTGIPRYPDRVTEPDDGSLRRKPKRLSDIPILESEHTTQFTRITDISDNKKITDVDRVDETDDSLLSVDKKISKFLNTAGEVRKQPLKPKGTTPKVERPEFEITDDLKSDECVLTVSEKVNRFVSTAEKLITPQELPERPKSPRCRNYTDIADENTKNVSQRISQFTNTSKIASQPRTVAPKVQRPDLTEVDEHNKFISTAEKLSKEELKKPVSLSTIDTKPRESARKSPERKQPTERSPERKFLQEQTYSRSPSPPRKSPPPRDERTPIRRPSNQYTNVTQIESRESKYSTRDSSPKLPDTTPKSAKRPSIEEPRQVLSPTGRLRSTETIKKAKALFENVSNEKDTVRQRDVLSRPSVFESKKNTENTTITRKRLSYSDEEDTEEKVITYKTITKDGALRSAKLELSEKQQRRSRSRTPEYLSNRTPERESTPDQNVSEAVSEPNRQIETEDLKTTKFGVTLKRTDSGRVTTTTSATECRQGSITTEKRITEEEVEEIFDLDVLEELLEVVVGYELRGKIRTQIRLVKKLIAENRLTIYIARRKSTVRDVKREPSPTKDVKKVTEYQSKYTKKTSPERKIVDNKLHQHTGLERTETTTSTTEYQDSYSYNERRTSSEVNSKVTRKSPEKISGKPTTRASPERKPFAQLKKTPPAAKSVEDDKPDWARQRNLRKTSETSAPVTKKFTSTTSTTTSKRETRRSSSPVKEAKPTDIITSSYGVGPTDENGTPLFGLKALRAQNKSSTTKVQGTVIKSEYYSENGGEPVGQVSVTKYSTDPKDLGRNESTVNNKGITSITTTQKFGYKDTPPLGSLTNKKKELTNVEESTKSSKVTRKNSVKALSQKFIENAVETLKSERQTSYPRAGLILRTSSFKEPRSGTDGSRETSPANGECESTVTVRTTTTRSSGGDTFLTNKSRVSGVKDVITRMKTEEYQEGDDEEDVKARSLLNKFIGSQVILSGMDSRTTTTAKTTTVSPDSSAKRTVKITTTTTEGGKPVTKTRVFETPITEAELQDIWDEQTLRVLLEQCKDYDHRRIIRARLRQVMAEQEACADLVEKAGQEQTGGAIEGESLLLPLLQGLLEAPETEQTPDSGTESGEDQRSGLIAEVQSALDKLSASLRSDSTDITPERRCSLLQLVTRLQAGLSSTTPKLERRLSSGQGRFGRRRQRQNRHTVGVSSEELADARRLMEEISLKDITPSPSQTRVTLLQKQNSESSVTSNSSSFNKFGKIPVKNATPKPFSSSNSVSNNSSSVHTPTDPVENLDQLFEEDPTFHDAREKTGQYAVTESSSVGSLERGNSLQRTQSEVTVDTTQEVDIKSVQQAVQQAAARKKGGFGKRPGIRNRGRYQHGDGPERENNKRRTSYEEKCNRFNTRAKKNKMKRANTIDIPKSLQFYEDEDDSDETEDEEQRRKNNYYALRGPIRVGNPAVKNTMPTFEPKTECDQKFMSFLNKNNQNRTNKTSVWAAHEDQGSIWGNRFGNIKNNFEKASAGASNPVRSFWKTTDDASAAGSVSQFGPKISKRSARNLQQMFEEKQRRTQDETRDEEQNVVTGSLTLKTEPEKTYKFVPQPLPVNKFSHAPQSAFKPLPKKVQAKPETLSIEPVTEIIKTEIKESKSSGPLYLYSPKTAFNSQNNSATTSPVVTSKPWVTNAIEYGGGKVVNMAAKKFELPPQQDNPLLKPRKLSKDNYKVFVPQQSPSEKLSAPFLVRNADQTGNTVRKLSGQYDNAGEKIPQYHSKSTVKYQPPQPETKHYTPNFKVPAGMVRQQDHTSSPVHQNNTNYAQCSPTQPQFPAQQQPKTYQAYTQPFQQTSASPNYRRHTTDQPQSYAVPHQSQGYTNGQHKTQNYVTAQQRPQSYTNTPQQQQQQWPQSNTNTRHDPPNHATAQYQPQNYSIRYDQPQNTQIPYKHTEKDEPRFVTPPKVSPVQIYQHVPGKERQIEEKEQEFTSTCQFTPQPTKAEPQKQPVVEVAEPAGPPPKLQTQVSNESVHEYTAISSKLMTGPVGQQAVTVRQKSPMNRNEHDMEAAFNLRNSLQKVGKTETSKSPSNSFKYKPSDPKPIPPSNSFNKTNELQKSGSFKHKPVSPPTVLKFDPANASPKNYTKYDPNDVPKPTVRPSSFKVKSADHPWNKSSVPNENKTFGVVKPMQQRPSAAPVYNNVSGRLPQARESLEINEKGQSVLTSKFHIPVISVNKSPNIPTQAQALSKSDSWHQICMASQETPPRGSPVAGVVRSKSSHALAVPQKQFEAGMSKEELIQKKRSIEAYFSSCVDKSPSPEPKRDAKVVKRSINRIKTSEKKSAYRQTSGGITRSRTLPDIICPELLDESNVDEAFEDLFKTA